MAILSKTLVNAYQCRWCYNSEDDKI